VWRGSRAPAAVFAAVAVVLGAPRSRQTLPSFERAIAPFAVVGEDGREHALPFLGGYEVPRPQFVDIDGDGDLDLFVQEYSNAIQFFENTGTRGAPVYTWRTDKYQDLNVGEWFRFVDIDADGDPDLIGEHPFSYIRHYRNEGTRTSPRFVYADSLRDATGAAIYLDRQNIPALGDIDCDDRLDFLVGRVEGTVARFEAVAPGRERFAFVQEHFEGIEIVGQIDSVGTQRHGANALALADLEGDGDLDLFWGDFFERAVLVIENRSRTCSTPFYQTEPFVLPYADSVWTSGYNAPAPVDLDGDGDLDFLMGVIGGAYNPLSTSAANFLYWERLAPERFELRTKRFLDGIDVGNESIVAVVDLDGDSDFDLVVGNKVNPRTAVSAQLHFYRNEGAPAAPRFRYAGILVESDAFHLAPAFGDLDGDGDPDLLLGTWNQSIEFHRNIGTAAVPRFIRDTSVVIRLDRVSNATPALADVDGDGDLDLFVGEANGEINFHRNDGTRTSPRFTRVSGRFDDIDVGRRSAPSVVDLDGDGLLDLVVGREGPGATAFRNTGNRAQPRFSEIPGYQLTLPALARPAFVDIDGDGKLDVLSGGVGGGIVFLRGK
jgi:hypothetical protein